MYDRRSKLHNFRNEIFLNSLWYQIFDWLVDRVIKIKYLYINKIIYSSVGVGISRPHTHSRLDVCFAARSCCSAGDSHKPPPSYNILRCPASVCSSTEYWDARFLHSILAKSSHFRSRFLVERSLESLLCYRTVCQCIGAAAACCCCITLLRAGFCVSVK